MDTPSVSDSTQTKTTKTRHRYEITLKQIEELENLEYEVMRSRKKLELMEQEKKDSQILLNEKVFEISRMETELTELRKSIVENDAKIFELEQGLRSSRELLQLGIIIVLFASILVYFVVIFTLF